MDRKVLYLLLAVLALAAFLRFYNIGAQNFSVDEVYTVTVSGEGLPELINDIQRDTNPPLFYVLMHFWTAIFGTGFAEARFPAALFGVAIVAACFFIGKKFFGDNAGLAAAFLAAISPLSVWLSQEARNYTLVTLLCLLSAYYFYLFVSEKKDKWLVGCAVVSLIAIYTYYYAVYIIIFENLFFFLYLKKWELLKKWVAAEAGVALLYLPWLPQMLVQTERGLKYGATFNPLQIPNIVSALSTGLSVSKADWGVIAALTLLLSSVVLLAVKKRDERTDFLLAYLVVVAGLIYLMPFIVGVQFRPRYLVFASPALFLLAGKGVSQLNRKWAAVFVVGLVALSAVPLWNFYFAPEYQKTQWQSAAEYVGQKSQEGDALAFFVYTMQFPFDYYYGGGLPEYGIPQDFDWQTLYTPRHNLEASDFPEAADRITGGHQRIWLVCSHHTFAERNFGLLKNYMDANYKLAEEKKFEGRYLLELYLYEI